MNHIPYKMGFLFHALHLRSTMKNYSPFFLTGVMCIVSLITLAPFAFVESVDKSQIKQPNGIENGLDVSKYYCKDYATSELAKPVLGIIYMGIFSTLIAYGMYEWALKVVPVAESAIYSYLTPIFAIPFSYLLLGEKMDLWFIIGGLIIAYGVYISERPNP